MVPWVYKVPDALVNRFGLSDIRVSTKYQVLKKDGKAKTFRTLIKLSEGEATMNVPKGKEPKKGRVGNHHPRYRVYSKRNYFF